MRCVGRNGHRVISAILLVVFVLSPVAAYAEEWMPGMGTVPGSGSYLDYKPWRFTEQIEAYNDYAMWQQQLKLPASERVANSFIEFQGKVRAGYRGLTVNQAAAVTGESPGQVIAWAQRMKDFLKRSPDARVVAKGAKGSMLAAGLVGVLVDVAGNAAVDAVMGKYIKLHPDGSVCDEVIPFTCPYTWTNSHYMYHQEGLLHGEEIPPALAWMFPGFLIEIPASGYELLVEAAERPVVHASWGAVELGRNPQTVDPIEWYYWDTDTVAGVGYLIGLMGDSTVCAADVSEATHPLWVYGEQVVGVVDLTTGSEYAVANGPMLRTGTAQGFDYISPGGVSASTYESLRQWVQDRTDLAVASGRARLAAGETEDVSGVPVELPAPASLPSVGVFNGQDASVPLTFDDPVADWVDLYDTPATLPSPIETTTGVDSDDQRFQVVLAPAIDEITQEARRRWPYAAIGMLFDPDVSPGGDPEPVSVAVPLPVPPGVPQPAPVEVRLDKAFEPVKPWRPVGAALVAVTTFAAMWAILKPELHV